MIPLKDNLPSRRFPLVNTFIIIVNVLVFIFESLLPDNSLNILMYNFGLVPVRLTSGSTLAFLTLFTSMFLHGSWLHLISNMLALYIFGDNIEDRLGHLGYLLFYLLGGVAAGLLHVLTNSGSYVPTVGASGAISAVLGAYILLYPYARVMTIIPIFFFIRIVQIPAVIYLGFWFISQLFNGTVSIVSNAVQSGDVAWWAHIGGFAAGMLMISLFRKKSAPDYVTYSSRNIYPRRNRHNSGW